MNKEGIEKMAENKSYLIHELADLANVSVRTIRYYLDEGLLPAPEVSGRYALFNTEHLERLELIRRLKDAYLPLKEIRQKMDSLSGLEVRNLLEKSGDSAVVREEIRSTPQPQLKEAGSEALDYIARLLETRPPSPEARSIHQFISVSTAAPQAPVHIMRAAPKTAQEADNETWHRVVLAPGVELHLRQPLEPENEKKIRQILDLANRLFRS
jgi:DNA-binding transcriptional MerR regulator